MILGKTNIDAQKAAEMAADAVRIKEDDKEIKRLLKEINKINIKDFFDTHEYINKQGGRTYSTYESKLEGLFRKIRDEKNIYSFCYYNKDKELCARREELSSQSYNLKITYENIIISMNYVTLPNGYRVGKSKSGKICAFSGNCQRGEETTKVIKYLKEIISLLNEFMQRYTELIENLNV